MKDCKRAYGQWRWGDEGHIGGDAQPPIRDAGDGASNGVVLWSVAALANDLGVDLEDVARLTLAKLRSRQEHGALGGSGEDRSHEI